jgi:hypothetical protein
MSTNRQNRTRIIDEISRAITKVEGPVEGCTWSEFDESTREVFTTEVHAILDAELNHRFGEESRVNVKIREALERIGEHLVRGTVTEQGNNV